jgi:nucleotide-binding universal stress UspA family protein
MFRRILVALDHAAGSQSVLADAIAIAQAVNAQTPAADCRLNLATVMYPLESGYPDPLFLSLDGFHPVNSTETYQNYAETWQTLQRVRSQWLQGLLEQVQRAGIAAESSLLLGDPGRSLCELAGQWPADLIVIGRRGRTGLSEMLLGSVSNYVMHHAPCSVLTVQGAVTAAAVGQTVSEGTRGV